jgi:hypothetical protein
MRFYEQITPSTAVFAHFRRGEAAGVIATTAAAVKTCVGHKIFAIFAAHIGGKIPH